MRWLRFDHWSMIGDRSAPACKKRHLSVSNWSKYLIVFFKIFLFLFCSLGLSSFFFIHINFVLASEERVIFIRLCISQIMDRSALGVVDSMQNENLFSCFWEYLSSRKKKTSQSIMRQSTFICLIVFNISSFRRLIFNFEIFIVYRRIWNDCYIWKLHFFQIHVFLLFLFGLCRSLWMW